MFAFDSLNNEVKINLNPIYQSLSALNEDKLDKTEYNNLFDGLFLESQKKLSNYMDKSREDYFMDEFVWLNSSLTETTPLNSAYYAAKTDLTGGAELFTSLNYNFNANYEDVDFTNIISEALIDSNIYKNRIELTGNLNFSDMITLTNSDIKTFILKNKNIANDFGIYFENNNNKFINIDGFKSITSLEFKNTPGEIKIKNCDSIINKINFSNVNSVDLKNILINVNETENLIFQNITNLKLEDATINATITEFEFVNSVKNATFDNVSFSLNIPTTIEYNRQIFNNAPNAITSKKLNNFYFKDCYLNIDGKAFFAGINGTFDGCSFKNLKLGHANNLNFVMDSTLQSPIEFSFSNSLNTVNITNIYTYDYIFTVMNNKNLINFKNECIGSNKKYNITIDEGTNTITHSPTSFNVYNFENINSDSKFTMNIIYGNNSNSTNKTYYRHPKIYLDINNVIKIDSPNNNLKYNTFDIYFKDSFNESNLIVSDIKHYFETTPILDWSPEDINTFNLHFYKDTLFNSVFYNKFLNLFGGNSSTKQSFTLLMSLCLNFYDAAGHQITSFN